MEEMEIHSRTFLSAITICFRQIDRLLPFPKNDSLSSVLSLSLSPSSNSILRDIPTFLEEHFTGPNWAQMYLTPSLFCSPS